MGGKCWINKVFFFEQSQFTFFVCFHFCHFQCGILVFFIYNMFTLETWMHTGFNYYWWKIVENVFCCWMFSFSSLLLLLLVLLLLWWTEFELDCCKESCGNVCDAERACNHTEALKARIVGHNYWTCLSLIKIRIIFRFQEKVNLNQMRLNYVDIKKKCKNDQIEKNVVQKYGQLHSRRSHSDVTEFRSPREGANGQCHVTLSLIHCVSCCIRRFNSHLLSIGFRNVYFLEMYEFPVGPTHCCTAQCMRPMARQTINYWFYFATLVRKRVKIQENWR